VGLSVLLPSLKEVKYMNKHRVEESINNWKDQPKKIARKMISQYGLPDEITNERLI
jgi:hypothetical protein